MESKGSKTLRLNYEMELHFSTRLNNTDVISNLE